jgi:hypothetical protein
MINPAAVLKALRAPKSDFLGTELSRVLAEINEAIQPSGAIRALSQAEAATIKNSLSGLFHDLSNSSYVRGRFTASVPAGLDERGTVESLKQVIDLRLSSLANAFTAFLDERLIVEVQRVRGTYGLVMHAKAYHDGYTGERNARVWESSAKVVQARSVLASTLAELDRLIDQQPAAAHGRAR